MKRKYIILLVFTITAISLVATEKYLDSFSAVSNGNAITIKWKSKDEAKISSYTVQRAGSDLIFDEITTELAKGFPTTYQFVDETAFKLSEGDNKALSKSTYYYRVEIQHKDNTVSYSSNTSVTHQTSSIRRTWGMLKEMFR